MVTSRTKKMWHWVYMITDIYQNENHNPAYIYLLKVNNRNTKRKCEICSKLAVKTPEWRQYYC